MPWGAPTVDDLQPWTTAVVSSVTVVAFLSVCLRLLARWEKKQQLWWDDWMILWSMAWNFAVVGFIFGMLHFGMGLQASEVPLDDIVMMAKFLLVAEILYVFNLVWTKLSFLLFYYRIFRVPYFKTWAYIIGAFVIAWVITITFLFIFICVPVEKIWYPDTPGKCIDQVSTWNANAASTILSDVAILVLPLPQVWKLQLKWERKVAVMGVFGLGFFVVFASAYRFGVLYGYDGANPTYTLAPTVGWTAIEMSAGIVSANLPTLLPAFRFIGRAFGIEKLVSRTHGSSAKGSNNTDGSQGSHGFTSIGTKGHERHLEASGGPGNNTSQSGSSDTLPLRNIRVDMDFRMTGTGSAKASSVDGLTLTGKPSSEQPSNAPGMAV